MNISEIGKIYTEALKAKYNGQMAEARANLALYLTNLVGIGEHSDLIEEQDKWIEKYSNAKDKLESLEHMINEIEKINKIL
jgi:hypothetical protein